MLRFLRIFVPGLVALLATASVAVAVERERISATPAFFYYTPKTPEQKLREVLDTHIWLGDRITDAMRAATGDPNISVIDKRSRYGDVYLCHYAFWGPRRVLICD